MSSSVPALQVSFPVFPRNISPVVLRSCCAPQNVPSYQLMATQKSLGAVLFAPLYPFWTLGFVSLASCFMM